MTWEPPPIPIVYPIAAFQINERGRTQPLNMRCETGHSSDDFVVKLWSNVELTTHGLAREIYGSLLAKFFSLDTPDIALVEIHPDFAESQHDKVIRKYIKNSPGLNFGSRFIRGAIIFSPPVPPSLLSIATRVFCFDMLIGNVDRCHPKINLFKMAENLTLYDHEQAFPFSRPELFIGGSPPLWSFIREPWSKDHILFSGIKGKDVSLEIEEFISDLLGLEDNILATIEEQIPSIWQAGIQNISSSLADTRENADLFKRSLQELLA